MRLTRQRERRRSGSSASGGFTLIEIMVVLLIVGLLAGLGVTGFRAITKGDLREGTAHLAGAIRYLFDRASITGKYHRLVRDISGGKYWAEVSDDRFYAPNEAETSAQYFPPDISRTSRWYLPVIEAR